MSRRDHRWYCSSVPAVPAFSQKGKNIVPLNLFIKLREQREHWNKTPHTPQASALGVQTLSVSFAPQLAPEN